MEFLEELKSIFRRRKIEVLQLEEAERSVFLDEVYRVLPYFTILIKKELKSAAFHQRNYLEITFHLAQAAITSSRSVLENIQSKFSSRGEEESNLVFALMDKAADHFQKAGLSVEKESIGGFTTRLIFSGWQTNV